MIKPDTLWNFLKHCKSSTTVGNVCRKLGRQEVELNECEQTFFDMINQSIEWFNDSVAENREKERKRKAEYREKKMATQNAANVPECPMGQNGTTGQTEMSHGTNGNVPLSRTIHPSIHPSTHPSTHPSDDNNSVCVQAEAALPPTHAPRFKPPKWESVLAFIRGEDCKLPAGRKIPEKIARDWFDYRTVGEWRTNGGAPINNWRTDLLSNAEKQKRMNRDAGTAHEGENSPQDDEDSPSLRLAQELEAKRAERRREASGRKADK